MRLKYLIPFLALFAAQPSWAAASPEMSSLEAQLSNLVAGRSGEFGIAALDLGSGRMVSVNGDTPFPMASTVKLAIAATYLAQVDHGRRSLSDRIGGTSADALMGRMLIHSDNIATDLLLANLGGPTTVRAGWRSTI